MNIKSFQSKFSTQVMSLMLLSGIAIAQNTKIEQNSWSGFYAGLNIGAVFNDIDLHAKHFGLTFPTEACMDTNFSSFFPGVLLGYLYPLESKLVFGMEGDFSYNVDQAAKISCNCPFSPMVSDHYSIENRLQGSIRARLGFLLEPHMLPFLSAGGSFANLGLTYHNEAQDYYSKRTTQSGWLLGGGIEWDLANSWSVRTEYYYIDYNRINLQIPTIYGFYDPNGFAHSNLNNNIVRLAVNHWFD